MVGFYASALVVSLLLFYFPAKIPQVANTPLKILLILLALATTPMSSLETQSPLKAFSNSPIRLCGSSKLAARLIWLS